MGLSTKQVRKLTDAIRGAREQLEPFRQARLGAVKEYIGRWYQKGPTSTNLSVPINMLGWMVPTYMRLLAANAPTGRITTIHQQYKADVKRLELALKYTIKNIDFEDSLQAAVLNAMFGLSVVKVGITDAAVRGFSDESGQPFVDPISLDDFFFDTAALGRDWQFVGDHYRLPLERIQGNPFYEQTEALKKYKGVDDESLSDDNGVQRTSSISRDRNQYERVKPLIDLWEVWLPHDNLVVTLMGELDVATPIRVVEWTGPDHGPYHLLRYMTVPDQMMPLAPITVLMDMHLAINGVTRKMNIQALNQKDIILGNKASQDDNVALKMAGDQHVIQVDNVAQFGNFRIGGVDQSNLAYTTWLREIFKAQAGGLDMLAGTSPMSETATQDKMLLAQATQQVSDMQRKTVAFAKKIMEDITFYLTRQPGIRIEAVNKVAGIDIPTTFMSDEFDEAMDLDIEVSPYSTQEKTPSYILQTLNGLLTQIVGNPALAAMMEQQGKQIDIGAVINHILELTSTEGDLKDIVIGLDPSIQEQDGPISAEGGKPAQTSREYIRTNRPGSTDRGKAEETMRAAMGANSQPAMQDQMNRPTG